MDIQTILLCLLIESILYFWFLFLAIDMFEVNDIASVVFERTVSMTSAFSVPCAGVFCYFSDCQQNSNEPSFTCYQLVFDRN